MKHQTQVTINLRAYKNNVRWFRNRLPKQTKLCAVVKADAYGHGLESIAPAAIEAGVDSLGIVDNWEAHRIRALGITKPIFRLRPCLADEAEEALEWDVQETVGSISTADTLSALGIRYGRRIPVHLKMDVGINRAGFAYPHQCKEIQQTCGLPGLSIVGAMTHFPCADDANEKITLAQLKKFNDIRDWIKTYVASDVIFHAANSAAALRFPAAAMDLARLGISLYGLRPSPEMPLPEGIEPVMSWRTRVALVRDALQGVTVGYGMTHCMEQAGRIATLPVGYADGYLRAFSNRSSVLIRGRRFPIVGRISMDMVTVDVSAASEIQVGDEAVLLGSQGKEAIKAHDLASIAGSIDYEIVCSIGRHNRDWRIYET